MNKKLLCVIAVLIIVRPLVASADIIAYEYSGPDFTFIQTNATGVTALSGSFTVDLGPSLTDPNVNYPVLDFFFSDGLSTYDAANFSINFSRFRTDAAGAITDFAFGLLRSGSINVGDNWFLDIRIDEEPVDFFNSVNTVGYCTSITATGECGEFDVAAAVTGLSGTLSPISVPEPGALILFALGLFGISLTRRRSAVAQE